MQWVATKYQTTAKCSYKYTLTLSFLNINGSWNIHQILLQNISILSLRIFLSFFTSSANTLLILRSSQDMAGFCVCDFCLCSSLKWYRDTVVIKMECNACWTFLEKKNLPYSCTAVKFYKLKSSHQITWCKSYWFPAMGELRWSPETLNCTSSVTDFCPLSTDYKYSVLESCLFTNVIEFPEIKKKNRVLKCNKVLRSQATKKSQHLSQGILNVKQFKAEHLHANISVFQNLFRSYSTTMLSLTGFSTSLLPGPC